MESKKTIFMLLAGAFLITYSWYQSGLAQAVLDNDTIGVVKTPTSNSVNTSATSAEISKLQTQINSLKAQITSLQNPQIVPLNDEYGYDPLVTYVTNPMTENLNVNGYRIGNYPTTTYPIYFDSNIGIAKTLNVANSINVGDAWENSWSDVSSISAIREDFGDAISGIANGRYSKAGVFIATGDDGYALYARADKDTSYAGSFGGNVWVRDGDLLIKDGSTIGYNFPAKLSVITNNATGTLAGYFDGPVKINRGQVDILNGNLNVAKDIHVGPALLGKVSVLDENNNGIALSVGANGNNAKAGFFQANGDEAVALSAITTGNDSSVANFETSGSNATAIRVMTTGANSNGAFLETVADWSHGVYAKTLGSNSNAIHGKAEGINAYAGYFDGGVRIFGNDLSFDNNLNPKIIGEGANSFSFYFTPDLGPDPFGIDVLPSFVFKKDNKLGIGTDPTKPLDIKTEVGNNAEIALQTGNNIHWGIYQDNGTGNLNFWHGDNRVSFTNKGVETKGLCLNGVCITSWKDLNKILSVVNPEYIPTQQ